MQHPPPPPLVPVKAAVTPQAGLNGPFLRKGVKPKAVDGTQTTTVNPFSEAAKGTDSDTDTDTIP